VPLAPVDLAKGEQHSDAYRAINPRRVVPTLVLEDALRSVRFWRFGDILKRSIRRRPCSAPRNSFSSFRNGGLMCRRF
jgi:hypothetical protein